jgi:hypothetical protein
MRTAQNIAAARGSSNLALFPVDGGPRIRRHVRLVERAR